MFQWLFHRGLQSNEYLCVNKKIRKVQIKLLGAGIKLHQIRQRGVYFTILKCVICSNVMRRMEYIPHFGKVALKMKSRHDDNFVVTGGTAGCHDDIAGTMTIIIILPAFFTLSLRNWVATSIDKCDTMTTFGFQWIPSLWQPVHYSWLIIDSDAGLSPVWRQVIISTNDRLYSIHRMKFE